MAGKSWAEQAIDSFFKARKSPTRSQCDQLALSISGASVARPVDVPGSLSYTIICTRRQSQEQHDEKSVLSFREAGSGLEDGVVELARTIHGSLVPRTTNHGTMRGSDPPLGIYAMSLLPGVACLDVLSYHTDMCPEEEAKHIRFITHLARYFARCRFTPQLVKPRKRSECQAAIFQRLKILMASPSTPVPASTLSELEAVLPQLFDSDYPQVLTHNDFSKINILVNPDTYEVTGIVDWSLGAVQPFGIELDCLFLMTGCMNLSGWHDYACRPRLWEAFWAKFWSASGIGEDDGGVRRETIRTTAETAAKVGAIMRYAFDRNADGRPSEMLSTSATMSKMLRAWLGG